MIIYENEGLHHLEVLKASAGYHEKGLINDEELSAIKRIYKSPFYTPNAIVRIGFFLLTCIISAFGCGFLSLLISESSILTSYGWFIFLGIGNYVALEVLTRKNRYYKAGVDEALMWISGGIFAGAVIAIANEHVGGSLVLVSVFILLLSLTYTLRFTDVLTAIVAYLSALAVVFFSWQKIGPFGLLTMPFVMMGLSALTYWGCRVTGKLAACYYYSYCLEAVEVVSLLTLYLSGNYYVVKELNDFLNGTISKTIPLAWFFWLWTVALPFLYIGFGVGQRSILLIRTGLLLIAAAVFTFRNYYHVLPVEQALTVAAIAVIALSWFLIRLLHTPKAGFTSHPLKLKNKEDALNVESLVVAETFSGLGSHTPGGTTFSGGRFGGGGSSSGY